MKLSIIIPAYNEEHFIGDTIQKVQAHSSPTDCEIIVVDGGSTDDTCQQAKAAGAKVVVSPKKGRAAQMNYGAEKAKGDILYFLHADSIPPPEFAQQVRDAVSEGYESGCFRLSFDKKHPLLNFYAWCTRFNINAFRFGDQSLFILRNVFFAIDGFRENHIVMEDNDIVRRIKENYTFTILADSVETSARTYQEVGIIKLQLIFVLIYTLYFLGVEQHTLHHIRKNVIR